MGFPQFVASGGFSTNIANQTMPITISASTLPGDILIAHVVNKALTVAISPPDSSWAELYQADGDCTTAADDHRMAVYWKRAVDGDAGSSPSFTKASGTVLFAGEISTWRNCHKRAPIDPTPPAATVTAAANDNIAFPAFTPTRSEVHIVYLGTYGNDLTTPAAAMSADVNPDCTTRYDRETSSGNDVTLCCTSGINDGSAIGSRTWAMASTADAGSTGLVFALVGQPDLPNNYKAVSVGGGMSTSEKIR